jgi:peptidoglycan/xylan/chitin deacetylase (PgdA/CDA1 family)
MNKLPVLMYHRVISERCPVPNDDAEQARYAVDLDTFAWQLDRLSRYGRTGVSMRRLVDCLTSEGSVPGDWVGITFDDGNESDYVHASPLLLERGFTATFFVCGERIDASRGLDRGMIADMTRSGMHMGAHGLTHRFLTTLDAREEEEEISGSRDLLSAITGEAVDHFAPPGGRYNRRTLGTLRRLSFRAVCTSDFGFNPRSGKRFMFRRIPVTAAITRAQFDAVAKGAALPLMPLYVRSKGLHWLRRALGEPAYRRLRSLGARK